MYVLKKYGTATTILFPLIDAGAQDFESTPVSHAAGDTQISKDEGAFTNTTNAFAHEGNGIYSLTLTATEMQAATVVVTVIDSATKAWEDQAVIIDTYGNASAEHAFDLDVATQDVNVASMDQNSIAVGVIAGGAVNADAIGADAITAAKIATDAIDADSLAANAVAEIQAGATGASTITVHTQEADTTTIAASTVSIYTDSGRTNLYTRVTTDNNGDFTGLGIDDGTYYYSATKALYTFASGSFVVSGNGTHNITGVSVSPSAPSSPDNCTIFGTLLDASGTALESSSITATVTVPETADGNQLVKNQVSTTTDSNGYFELELVRGSTVTFKALDAGLNGSYTVPEAATQDVTTWTAN